MVENGRRPPTRRSSSPNAASLRQFALSVNLIEGLGANIEMSPLPISDRSYSFFDLDTMSRAGLDLRERYNTADPFPHIVLDDLFPEETLDLCLEHFPVNGAEREFNRPQERLKTAWNPDSLCFPLRSLFYSFNSRPFISFLENLTGIDGLIPDPYFGGGGFHQTKNDGKLDIHTDFNLHSKLNLERRINVLVYLNKDWKETYGGCLELWNADVSQRVQLIVPKFNRTVVFNTCELSWHGHPEPVSHPLGLPRRSIALYYYTATWDNDSRAHTTHFKPRPNSQDRTDYEVAVREAVREWIVPPGFLRLAKRIRHGRANT
jgi:2OG-Fe(II) oxygenase superfamily